MRFVVCLALLLAHCNRDPASPRGAEAPQSAAPSTPPSAALLPDAARTAPLGDGCFTEVDLNDEPAKLQAALARACAPGMRPLVARSEHALGRAFELAFELTAPDCVRVIASAPDSAGDVELELVDAQDRSVGKDALTARFALVGERGPICLEPGRHRVRGKTGSGDGKLLLDVLGPDPDAG